MGSSLAPPTAKAAAPRLTVTQVVDNLTIPWDVTWVGGLMLYDQRAGGIWSKRGSASPQRVTDAPEVFTKARAACSAWSPTRRRPATSSSTPASPWPTGNGEPKDVEVWKWRLTSDTTATQVKVLVTGIPLVSGRHSGCRLRFRSATMLYIGTGDAAVGTNPQNLKSLGGKVLRVRSDGSDPDDQSVLPRGGKARYVWTYGHRNVQGLAFRPGNDQL